MKHRKIIVSAGSVLALALSSAPAGATHKSWYLRNGGASCQSNTAQRPGLIVSDGAIVQQGEGAGSVVCPVTLAGRFASSSGPAFPMAEWAIANYSTMYVIDGAPSDDFSCSASAISVSGGGYWGRSVSSSGVGTATLELYDLPTRSWGGTLGSGNITVRGLGVRCWLPANSEILGYRVNICQYNTNCSST
jgi:hypothetical protein